MGNFHRHADSSAIPSRRAANRRWLAVCAALAVVVGASYGVLNERRCVAKLADVRQQAYLTLSCSRRAWHGEVSGLSLHLSGTIEGEAEVWASNWEPQRLRGRVDLKIYHDWFEPSCTLRYRPLGLASGQLEVRYRFH